MRERPINMRFWEVSAILGGHKTQVRIPYKVRNGQPHPNPNDLPVMQQAVRLCPLGKVNDRLWVRQQWAVDKCFDGLAPKQLQHDTPVYLLPSNGDSPRPPQEVIWRRVSHMPKWASRIWLAITNVSVQRLHDISDGECQAEGIYPSEGTTLRGVYEELWKRKHGASTWDANPWVWVIEFRRVDP